MQLTKTFVLVEERDGNPMRLWLCTKILRKICRRSRMGF